MFLTAYNLPNYLMSKGLISAESLVSGDFALAESGRRNRNFKILRQNGPGLFVKQIKTSDQPAILTLQREAKFYRTVQTSPQYADLRGLIPNFVSFDAGRHALTLELIAGAESLAERVAREGPCNEGTARRLGQLLGSVHSLGPRFFADESARNLFTYQQPWPMLLDQTGYGFLAGIAPVGAQLATAIQRQPALQPLLSALRGHWNYDSLTHGDMKWDNCLIVGGSGSETPRLAIVDWELVDLGDGAWDVAGIFKEYILAAQMSESQRRMAVARKLPEPPACILESMQPSVRAFWNAYAAARSLPEPQSFLDRAVKFTAARMLIAVLEYLFSSPQLGEFGATVVQTSANILLAPEVARTQLLGAGGA